MNPQAWLAARSGTLSAWLAVLVCCGVAALAWLGYRATEEWQRSSAQLVQRRTQEVAGLLTTALRRDMRAVQSSILDGREWDADALAAPQAMNDTIQGAFARYPYPEAFFAKRLPSQSGFFFARSDRRPAWLSGRARADTYPVEIAPSPQAAQSLLNRVDRDVLAKNQYSIFEAFIDGNRYQVVARILYKDFTRDTPQGVFGFIVDLDWVRNNYFSSITQQVARIARTDDGVDVSILDERGGTIVGEKSHTGTSTGTGTFPVAFFDPAIVAGAPPADLRLPSWSVEVRPGLDSTLAIAARGAHRTLIVVGMGAVALGLGLVITARASRSAAATAAMRADFVATVTHALKTPVSVIRGVGETLIRGRVSTPERLHEYAQLLMQEGHRLTRLIDNMLAYARVTDTADVYFFEAHSPGDVVEEVVKGFQRLLTEGDFSVSVFVQPELPAVRADRTSLVLALDNLVDNAMRYSGESRSLIIRTELEHAFIIFSVRDAGLGIPQDELARVLRRSVRGRSATGHGSGLGLAIASRIAADHAGQLKLESIAGTGTTATLCIPVCR